MIKDYPGETDAKRLARLAVYERVLRLQPAETRVTGQAIVLAGPDAGEIGALRYFLNWEPTNCWFVENTYRTGIQRVKRYLPKANTHFGDIESVVDHVGPISFLNLDIMGYIEKEEEEIFRLARPHITDWGMVFCSFYRGRERRGTNLRTFLDSFQRPTLEENRVAAYTQRIQSILGWDFVPVFSLAYNAKHGWQKGSHTAMGILGFQKVPRRSLISKRYWNWLAETPVMFGGEVPTDRMMQRSYLRVEALNLRMMGFDAANTSSILNTHGATVASWFAAQSKGSYNSQ